MHPARALARTSSALERASAPAGPSAPRYGRLATGFAAVLRARSQQIEDVLRPFAMGSANDFYCRPDIPPKKLANAARTWVNVKPEDVIGLIDCTLFGSAKDCVLFTA